MDLIKSQHIYIDTRKCEGTPYEFKVNIPHGIINCTSMERMRISLLRWVYRVDWYMIRSPFNTFTVTYNDNTYNYTIPEGSPTYYNLSVILQTLLNNGNIGTVVVLHDENTNKLTFTFTTNTVRTFTFPTKLANILGFSTNVVSTVDNVLVSNIPLNMLGGDEFLHVSCEGVTPHRSRSVRSALDTTNGITHDKESILASVLVNNCPFESAIYEDDGNTFGHYLNEKTISGEIKITVRNMNGEIATFLPHSHMVLRIDTHTDIQQSSKNTDKTLKNIEEYMRLMFVSKALQSNESFPTGNSNNLGMPSNAGDVLQ